MTALTHIRGGHVAGRLTRRLVAVVTAVAAGGDPGVIKIRSEPAVRSVAVAALQIGHHVTYGFTGRLSAVVTDDAIALHRQRDLRVIYGAGWIPGRHQVAGGALLGGGRMGRPLTLSDTAVMAADAAAEHFIVIEMHEGAK